MEDKLTLEHLSAYFPYSLRMIFEGKGGREIILSSITNQGKHGIVISGGTGPMWLNSCGFKPILRPLSDLTKEIEHNREKFVPIDDLAGRYNSECGEFLYRFKNNLSNIEDAPYTIMQKLFEWHFDVFGLIDKGLAIDINTIQEGENK